MTFRENEARLKRHAMEGMAFQLSLAAFVLALLAFALLGRIPIPDLWIAAAFAVLYVWFVVYAIRRYADERPRIVPYFERKYFRSGDPSRPVAEESRSAFRAGTAIAADLTRLDDVARQMGVTPLSSFGFGDDLFHQTPQWSDITEGVRTIETLIPKADNQTAEDLRTLLAALQKVRATQQRFSLILRYGPDEFISGVEMEKRIGSFWF